MAKPCRPLVYKSKLTGRWTVDCEQHSYSKSFASAWFIVFFHALYHRDFPED